MKNLKRLIKELWDGDITYEEATNGFTPKQLLQMDKWLEDKENYKMFAESEDLYEGTHPWGKLIQRMINNWEG